MFDDYKGMIQLQQLFKDEYGYSCNDDLRELSNQSFIELEGNGADAMFWINYRGKKYLFKPIKDFECNVWGELLGEKFASILGIPCAKYRAANYMGTLGVLSESILEDDETLILGSEIFQKFLNSQKKDAKETIKDIINNYEFQTTYKIPSEFLTLSLHDQQRYLFNHLNNLNQVKLILKQYKNMDPQAFFDITKHLFDILVFDIFTLQGDRHPNNWGIKEKNQIKRPAEVFDNCTSLGLGYIDISKRLVLFREEYFNAKMLREPERIYHFIHQIEPSFTLSEDNIVEVATRKKDYAAKVLDDLLQKSNPDEQDRINELYTTFNSEIIDKFDDILKEVEDTNDLKMRDEVYYYISNILQMHSLELGDIISKYRRSKLL